MNNFWLLGETTLEQLSAAERAGLQPDAKVVERYRSLADDMREDEANPILKIVDGVAEITVQGVLTGFYSRMAMLYGYATPYSAIIDAVRRIRTTDGIRRVDFVYDTPGGTVAGFSECIDEMRLLNVPTRAIVLRQCASGGYGLAAQADEILCNDRASLVGSIGVAVTMYVDEQFVTVTSSNAPKKRPDVKTPEGIADVQAELDQFEDLFVEDIAEGRNISVDDVRERYGKGASFVYVHALERSMVDGLYQTNDKNGTSSNEINEDVAMTYEEWAKANPAEAAAHEKAMSDNYRAEGAATENDRIGGLLIRAEAAGEKGLEIVRPLIDEPGATMTQRDAARLDTLALQANADTARTADNPETGEPAGTKPEEVSAENAQERAYLLSAYKLGTLDPETEKEARAAHPGIFDDVK